MNELFRLGSSPLGWWINETTTTFTSYTTHDAPNEYDSGIYCLPKSGVIEQVGFYVVAATYTGTSSGGFEVALKTLNTSGDPDTTNYGGSSGTVFTIDQFSTGWNWCTLSSPATGTVGDLVGVLVKAISASATNYLRTPNYTMEQSSLPRRVYYNSIELYGSPIFAIKYSDGYVLGRPLKAFVGYNYDSADSPDEVGAKIYPFAKMKVAGVITPSEPGGTNAPYTYLLYDSGDNLLASVSVDDKDKAQPQDYPSSLYFSEVTLSTGTFYRLTLRPDSATYPVAMPGYDFITGAYRYCVPDGENWQLTYRTNGGAWTDEEDKVPYLGLVVTEVTGAGGGNGNGGTPSSSTGTANYYGWA